MFCLDCGKEMPDKSRFCMECGTKLEEFLLGEEKTKPQAPDEISISKGDVGVDKSETTIDARDTSARVEGGIHVRVGGDGDSTITRFGEHCPICGFVVKDSYFQCRECRRNFICSKHYDERYRICEECVVKLERQEPEVEEKPKTESGPGLPAEISEAGMEMVLVPAGEFVMGSDEGDYDDEHPQHKIYLDVYYLGKYPVTNGQYKEFLEETGHDEPESWDEDEFNQPDQPVVGVSWNNAVAFCRWLSKKTGEIYRLPSEAEWEKAARGTDARTYPWGEEAPSSYHSNINKEVGGTTEVGSYPAGKSPYGCYDMFGNVWEWCNDWYDGDYYKNSPYKNPKGPNNGECRVLRGGSWINIANGVVCAASRVRLYLDARNNWSGFRCVC